MVPHHPQDGHPPTQGWATTRRKCTVDFGFGTYTLLMKLTPGDNCHGCSLNNSRMVRRKCTTDLEFGTYTLFSKLTSGDKCHGWSPTFPGRFTCQPRDGHPPTKGWSPLLALLGPVWHHLAQVVHVWPHLASFGPVWPHERSSIFRHCACLHTWLC